MEELDLVEELAQLDPLAVIAVPSAGLVLVPVPIPSAVPIPGRGRLRGGV